MPNITISLDESLLKQGRLYAQKHRTTLNALIREQLKRTVMKENNEWLDEIFSLADKLGARSKGPRWKREEIYDV